LEKPTIKRNSGKHYLRKTGVTARIMAGIEEPLYEKDISRKK
jgi:hypothetical protein